MALSKRLTSLVTHWFSPELIELNRHGASDGAPLQNYTLMNNLGLFERLKKLTIVEVDGLGQSIFQYDGSINQ